MAWLANKSRIFNPRRSLIRVARIEPFIDSAITCRLCENPSCVVACPKEALKQNATTGTISIDGTKCSGCNWCIEACEFGAITIPFGKKTVVSCDLCDGRPLCVDFCPRKALELLAPLTISNKARHSA